MQVLFLGLFPLLWPFSFFFNALVFEWKHTIVGDFQLTHLTLCSLLSDGLCLDLHLFLFFFRLTYLGTQLFEPHSFNFIALLGLRMRLNDLLLVFLLLRCEVFDSILNGLLLMFGCFKRFASGHVWWHRLKFAWCSFPRLKNSSGCFTRGKVGLTHCLDTLLMTLWLIHFLQVRGSWDCFSCGSLSWW